MKASVLSRKMAAGLLLAGAALAGAVRAEEPEVVLSPIHFGGLHEFGLFERGVTSDQRREFVDEWMDHFGAYITQEAVVDGKLALKAGLGGVFMFPKAEEPGEQFGGSQFKAFYVGPTVAEAMYHFGGVGESRFVLGGGMFPFKYNPDASNLGEYLFRSVPYPTVLQTGGLTAIGANAAVLQGLRASLNLGNLTADLLLTTETSLPPLYNGSVGVVAGYKVADGLLDIGAGVNFRHIIPVKPSGLARTDRANSAFNIGGTWYAGDSRYYRMRGEFLKTQYDNLLADTLRPDKADTAKYVGYREFERVYKLVNNRRDDPDSAARGWAIHGTTDWYDSAKGGPAEEIHYTSQGIILMGRLGIDLKKVLPGYNGSAQDLRLYAEAAVLGVKDYPIYYEKIGERIPVMAGVNLPTFGLLDLFAVQVEYFKSPNLNSLLQVADKNHNVPYIPDAGEGAFSDEAYSDVALMDDYAWSILMQKRFWSAFTASAQLARDHHRTFANRYFYGSRMDPTEITHRGPGLFDFEKSSWYWMFQLGWNI